MLELIFSLSNLVRRPQFLCSLLAMVVLLTIVQPVGSGATQQVSCAAEQGWFVRVCDPKTKAEGIDIWIGVGGNGSTHHFWKRWHHGDPTEFPFPIDLVRAKEVWFKAQTATDGEDVYLGFGFNGRIIKHIDMDDINKPEEYEQSRGDDTDEFDCP
jgi:hypothetical protein